LVAEISHAKQAFFRAPSARESSGKDRSKPHGREVDWRTTGARVTMRRPVTPEVAVRVPSLPSKQPAGAVRRRSQPVAADASTPRWYRRVAGGHDKPDVLLRGRPALGPAEAVERRGAAPRIIRGRALVKGGGPAIKLRCSLRAAWSETSADWRSVGRPAGSPPSGRERPRAMAARVSEAAGSVRATRVTRRSRVGSAGTHR
jgi:hypothetical protein